MSDDRESYRIVIVGEVLADCFEDGSEIIGGAPLNVAWNLRGFGFDPLMVSAVGDDDLGREILASMESFGLRTDGVQRVGDKMTGRVNVTLEDGEPTYDIVRDVAYDHVDPQTAAMATGHYHGGDGRMTLYHGTVAARAGTRDAINRLKSEGDPRVFFDINVREGNFDASWLDELMRGVDVLKCNWDEMRMLIDDGGSIDASDADAVVDRAGRYVDDSNLSGCVLTAGADGAYHVGRGNSVTRAETPNVPPDDFKDAVGAGDALASVVIAALCGGVAPETALPAAVEHAARVCTLRGATTENKSFYRLEF